MRKEIVTTAMALGLLLVASGCTERAFAQNTPRTSNYIERQGSSSPYVGGVLMQTCGAAYCATENIAQDTDPLVFPWGAQVVVDCTTTAIVCWTMTGEQDVGALTAAAGLSDDAGYTGMGSCVRVLANTYRSFTLEKRNFGTTLSVGRRINACSGTGGDAGPARPCRDNSDCTLNSDSGTCKTADAAQQPLAGGAFLYASEQCGWVNE